MPSNTTTIKILILEDHQATLEGLSSVLAREDGFEIVAACDNSDEGLPLADKLRPDVILLDLHLPGVLDTRRMIDEFIRVPDSKVIIFSAENRLAFVQAVLSMGVSAYLLKSERIKTVADTIRRVMRGERSIVSQEVNFDSKKITPSEQEVLHMLGRGMKYQEIAEERLTSIATARKQCEVLLLKLGLENREQLIAWAVQNGYGNAELG